MPNPTQPSQAAREYSRGFGAGLDHIANFINALDSAEMTAREVRSAIYSECLTARPSIRESLAGETNVERVARAIALEFDIDPDVFIGMHGKEKWVNEWHKIARAALSTLERTTDAG